MTDKTSAALQPRPWHGRGLTSLLISLIFVTLALSGLVLYLAPPCRVARESGWTVFLLSKDQWNALHVIMACAFVVAGTLHVYFNWRILMRYLVIKRKFHLKGETVTALSLFLILFIGAIFELPPFGYLTALTEEEKAMSCGGELLPDGAVGSAVGSAGGSGRLSLQAFCTQRALSLEDTMHFLEAEGFSVRPESTLRDLAHQKDMTAFELRAYLESKK